MRIVFATLALSASALSLGACSEPADEAPAETTAASSEAEPAAMDQAATDTAVLNASLVTIDQLQALTGVNPELAQAIVDGQPYESATAFNDVLMQSLSADEAAQVRERVFVPIDLNSASREDIALVPGMSDRMVGEFLEYRPYENIEEFNREIGKYVDEAEVARLRQYVTL